ncbi:MAG: glycosyltransferase, partial [Nitrospirae bacterium]|nr:glycosyltransferase [Nitrospirota bacterium]
VNGDGASCAAANGQYLLIRRSMLEDVGGIEAVRSEIVEDLALARLVKKKGFRIHFAPGEGRVEARMYRSFRSLWQGWSKNLFVLSGGQMARLVRPIGVRLLLDIAPAGAGLAALAGALVSPSLGTLVLATASVTFYGGRSFHLKDVWARPCAGRGYALLHPLAAVVLLSLLWYSAYLHRWVGEVRWRGRNYPCRVDGWMERS